MLAELRRISSFDPEHLPLAHLGNGTSIIAVRDGRSVDTTMAFTPSAGLVMSTRSGRATPPLAGRRDDPHASESAARPRGAEAVQDNFHENAALNQKPK